MSDIINIAKSLATFFGSEVEINSVEERNPNCAVIEIADGRTIVLYQGYSEGKITAKVSLPPVPPSLYHYMYTNDLHFSGEVGFTPTKDASYKRAAKRLTDDYINNPTDIEKLKKFNERFAAAKEYRDNLVNTTEDLKKKYPGIRIEIQNGEAKIWYYKDRLILSGRLTSSGFTFDRSSSISSNKLDRLIDLLEE